LSHVDGPGVERARQTLLDPEAAHARHLGDRAALVQPAKEAGAGTAATVQSTEER